MCRGFCIPYLVSCLTLIESTIHFARLPRRVQGLSKSCLPHEVDARLISTCCNYGLAYRAHRRRESARGADTSIPGGVGGPGVDISAPRADMTAQPRIYPHPGADTSVTVADIRGIHTRPLLETGANESAPRADVSAFGPDRWIYGSKFGVEVQSTHTQRQCMRHSSLSCVAAPAPRVGLL